MSDMERWKRISGWPYSVSETGRVRNNTSGALLRLTPDAEGYHRVNLRHDGKRTRTGVHRLVLRAFRGPPPHGHECNHKDGDKENNRLDNLEWVTHQENVQHAVRMGLHHFKGEANGKSILTQKKVVRMIKRLPDFGEPLPMRLAEELAREGGVAPGTIYGIHSGKRWTHLQNKRMSSATEAGDA